MFHAEQILIKDDSPAAISHLRLQTKEENKERGKKCRCTLAEARGLSCEITRANVISYPHS